MLLTTVSGIGSTDRRQTGPRDRRAPGCELGGRVSVRGQREQRSVAGLSRSVGLGVFPPVQLPVVLTHDANEDPCEAYPTRQLRFDLTPIRERYRAAYGLDSGTVLLLFHPALAADQPHVYQF